MLPFYPLSGWTKLLGTSGEEMESSPYWNGLKLAELILILILAWSIGTVMKELGSADYLIQALDGVIDPMWFPSLVLYLPLALLLLPGHHLEQWGH